MKKRQAESKESGEVDYFHNFLTRLNNIVATPVIGTIVGPYAIQAVNVLSDIDNKTDGSLSNVVNSIMPCNLSGNRVKCEGSLNKRSVQTLLKKLVDLIPPAILPTSLASVLKLVAELL